MEERREERGRKDGGLRREALKHSTQLRIESGAREPGSRLEGRLLYALLLQGRQGPGTGGRGGSRIQDLQGLAFRPLPGSSSGGAARPAAGGWRIAGRAV
eukprot:2049642-Pyramimonas_sp.AAC.2